MFWDQSSVVRIAQKMHPSHHCLRSTAWGHVSSVATRGPRNTRLGGRCSHGKSPRPNLLPDFRREEQREHQKGEIEKRQETKEMERDRKREFVFILNTSHLTPSHPELASPASHLPNQISQISAAAKGSWPPPTHTHHVLCSKQW